MNSKFILLIIVMLSGSQAAMAQPSEKTRLSKISFKGNDFMSETSYEYDARLRIKKIVYKQDRKLHYTISNFMFNEEGQLKSYIKTYNLKVSPQKTAIYYDGSKQVQRIEIVNTQKTDKPDTVHVFNFSRNGNQLAIESRVSTTVYHYDPAGNIKRIGFSTNGADPFLFDRYDHSLNPLALIGGYIDETPLSKNNHSWQQLGSTRYISTRKITYEQVMVHKYVPGGPKIPTQYRQGLPLQIVTSWYDPDAKRTITTETVNYTYTNPAP
ncbi:hypothetical protein [Niabella hirudinis]|uniref:hypothetical protein n=1 Tax=Niabella hirudinis TaxID=1285929 RepID=UPI003EB89169